MRRVLPFPLVFLAACRAGAGGAPPPTVTPTPEAAPWQLACLAKHYVGTATSDALVLPDGTSIPLDDGKTKSFEQTLDDPDAGDAFLPRYETGAIRPVTAKDHDPGRVRLDALFKQTYGASEEAVSKQLVAITFVGQTLGVHPRAKPAFERVSARLETAVAADPTLKRFLTGVGGTFNWRPIAGTDRASSHSYGVSLDLNTKHAHYWRWQLPAEPITWANEVPQSIVDAFEAEGFLWGGRWYHYDTMHFEWRPELFDAACGNR